MPRSPASMSSAYEGLGARCLRALSHHSSPPQVQQQPQVVSEHGQSATGTQYARGRWWLRGLNRRRVEKRGQSSRGIGIQRLADSTQHSGPGAAVTCPESPAPVLPEPKGSGSRHNGERSTTGSAGASQTAVVFRRSPSQGTRASQSAAAVGQLAIQSAQADAGRVPLAHRDGRL